MNTRTKLTFMSFAALAMTLDAPLQHKDRREVDQHLQKPKKVVPKGMIKFEYGYNVVYALNQKNADKKAKKLGYIKP